ncbi:MAG: 16S rRNA (uracil(1498)-N(3))-methyltransferase [Oscillospiraceae bacterium]|jgi:16S rRNA (uracil1498-N3)-methyltransferase|nr:16S rRNA (uracil(1498)-N(3))-methyltransferase [Oscillospiraceae bacterium]
MDSIRFPRFFIDTGSGLKAGDAVILGGDDAKHICTVLRMKAGEKALLCGNGLEYPAEIIAAQKNCVEFKVTGIRENGGEPKTKIRLFQCVPKGEKLDLIVQKATELGVSEIIPVISKRCVSRPDKKSNKIQRLQKITEAAAKQSGRGKIPVVHDFTDFNCALKLYKKENMGIIFYENGGEKLNKIFEKRNNFESGGLPIDVFIGSEGGFEPAEIEAATEAGLIAASLGKLILRTETAPIAALAIIMNLTGEI